MSGNFRATWTVTIDRPVEEVYDYVANPNNHANWSPKPYKVVDVVGEPGEKGTTFTSIGWVPGESEHRNQVEVTAADRPGLLEFTSDDAGHKYVSRFSFSGNGGSTTVTRTADWPKPGGVAGLVFPLISAALIKPDVNKGLRKLKAALETG